MSKTKREQTAGSLYDLVRAYQRRDHNAYRRLLTNANISKDLKVRLTTKKENWRKLKNPQFQEEEIELSQRLSSVTDKQIKEQEKICERACEEVQKAQEALRIATEEFNKQKQKEKQLKEEKKQIEMVIAQKKLRLEKMEQLVLVHPTAAISCIDKKREGMLVFTKFDFDNIAFPKIIDSVFNYQGKALLEKEDKEAIEKVRDEFETLDEYLSAISYIEMVTYYYLEGYNYELLYNSKGIKHMLEILEIS